MKLLVITQRVNKNDQLLGFFVGWLALMAKHFESLIVLCLEKGDFDLPENVRVISLGKDLGESKARQLFNFYSNIIALRSQYDAVFVHMNPIWAILGSPFWKAESKKTILWYTHKAVTDKLRLAVKMSDVILTASKESFRLDSDKVVVTGHGIDTNIFKPDDSLKNNTGRLKILSVGRLAPVKNYGTLIESAKILHTKGVDFEITLIGEAALEEDGNYEKGLRQKISELGLDKNFTFLGKVVNRELPRYYQSHDIFVHLSKTGSLDKAILEAMACGMKVLSSNDSARAFLPSEMIFHEDNANELADKIISAKDKPVGPSLVEYVRSHHNLDTLIGKITSIIKDEKTD